MLPNKTNIYAEAEMTAVAVAELIVSMQKEKLSENEPLSLAVSGGSTPNILFSLLAGEYKKRIDWEKIKIFWVDERCVPPTDKESNFGTTNNLLLKNVPIPQSNIFRMQGEQKPEEEALRYSKILADELTKKSGLPEFDLILLGMGDDGHTASIFPNNLALLGDPQTVATVSHPVTGQERITLTGNVICNAKKVVMLVTGHTKSNVLEEILHEEGDFERYPAYYILVKCDAELYLDDEAAERL